MFCKYFEIMKSFVLIVVIKVDCKNIKNKGSAEYWIIEIFWNSMKNNKYNDFCTLNKKYYVRPTIYLKNKPVQLEIV